MTDITQTEFMETIGQMDVMPKVDESTLRDRFHVSYWKLRNRVVVGKSISDSWGIKPTVYFSYD